MSMGIALPKWIVQEGMGKFTLAFYLSLLGIFLPWLVSRWWYGTQKVTRHGTLQSTSGNLFREYKEDLDESSLVAALSCGDEFKEILKGNKADSGLATVEKKILQEDEGGLAASNLTAKDKKKLEELEDPVRRKALALLWAYLRRAELDDSSLNDEKFEVAPTANLLNENFTDISHAFGSIKPLLASYHVSQHLIQAIVPGSSPLLQLPNFTPKVVQAVQGASARSQMSVQTFMSLSHERRKEKAVGPGLLTEAQLREAENLARQLPYFKVEKAFFKVHGERYVTPNSLVQFVVKARVIPPGCTNIPPVNEKDLEDHDKLTNPNAEEEPRVGPPLAHGPYFARDHSPRWHVFLGDTKQGRIAVPPFTFTTFDKPLFTEDGKPTYAVQTLKMQFGAPPQPGHYTFTMLLVCDSYVGLDTKMNVVMVVEDAAKAEEIVEEGEISEPEEGLSTWQPINHELATLTVVTDTIAGQMRALRSGMKEDSDSGSNTEGEDNDDDTSETDTDTDED
jgi:translocation protein SEC63